MNIIYFCTWYTFNRPHSLHGYLFAYSLASRCVNSGLLQIFYNTNNCLVLLSETYHSYSMVSRVHHVLRDLVVPYIWLSSWNWHIYPSSIFWEVHSDRSP
jgi:hypothetical protein